MVFSRLFRSRTEVLKDKIIYTQKSRISSLESEIKALKNVITSKDSEVKGVRTNFERSKERLIDQIIELSDKFADINQNMLDIAHENARMKVILHPPKRSQIMYKPEKKQDSRKAKTKKKGKRK